MYLSDDYSKQARNSAVIYQNDKNGPVGVEATTSAMPILVCAC
jgi:hypothetical protein